MLIIASICARGGSKGVPGKNKRKIHGRPLIEYTIECAQKTPLINEIVVSTDDEEIASIARENGLAVPFMRPQELASDTASKWPVFIHLVEKFEQMNGKKIDVLVDLEVTVPLRTPQDIEGSIKLLLADDKTDVVVTAYDAERNPYFNMVELDDNNYAHIVKKPGSPLVRRQDAPEVYSLTGAIFAIKREALYKYSHWSTSNFKIYPIPRLRAVDIDTEIDLKFVEFLMSQSQSNK